MNKPYLKYKCDLEINDFLDFIKQNECKIYYLEIKDKIYFYTTIKHHKIISKNEHFNYLYSIGIYGMFIRFFKIEKILPSILSLFLLFLLSNMIFDIQINGDSNSHKEIIKNILNINQSIFLNKNKIVNKLKLVHQHFDWYEVIQKGSMIEINYLPRYDTNTVDSYQYDLIASKDSVIASFDIRQGNKIVNVNQKVNKGDILVSHITLDSKNLEKTSEVIGRVYGYTFQKVEIEEEKSNLPLSVQYYLCLLKSRMALKLDENEKIIHEISLQFDVESDTIRIVNFYVLYEMISIVGESNG